MGWEVDGGMRIYARISPVALFGVVFVATRFRWKIAFLVYFSWVLREEGDHTSEVHFIN